MNKHRFLHDAALHFQPFGMGWQMRASAHEKNRRKRPWGGFFMQHSQSEWMAALRSGDQYSFLGNCMLRTRL